MFPLFFPGATFHGHHHHLLEEMVGAMVHMQNLPQEDRVALGLLSDMIRTDRHRFHVRARVHDHDRLDEGALAQKAPVSTDDEALVIVATVIGVGVGVGASRGAEAGTVTKEELSRSTCGVENEMAQLLYPN